MRYSDDVYTTKTPMAEKALILLAHFVDLFIGGGLLFTFINTFGDWQAGVSLGILIMFAILRGASLLEDINSKKEDRRQKKIQNDEREFDLHTKKNNHSQTK